MPIPRPMLARQITHQPRDPADPDPGVRDWIAHVDAGRIGARTATPQIIHANHLRTEALLGIAPGPRTARRKSAAR